MSKFRPTLVLSAIALVATAGSVALADPIADAGRAVLDKHKLAVVTVEMVIKQTYSFGGQSQEQESPSEATGTVIDPSGLTVLSLMTTDPTSLVRSMMEGSGRDREFNMEARVTDVKLLMDDGTEIPAKVVLRDKDLDLAFIRPKEKQEKPFAFVDLKDATSPRLLDEVLILNRLGKVASRAYSVSEERVVALIEKPRTFYDVELRGVGLPVFALDGKIVGISVMRIAKGGGGGMGGLTGMFGGGGSAPYPMVLPAPDVAEAAAQAPQASEVPDEAPKPEAPEAPAAPGAEQPIGAPPGEAGAAKEAPAAPAKP